MLAALVTEAARFIAERSVVEEVPRVRPIDRPDQCAVWGSRNAEGSRSSDTGYWCAWRGRSQLCFCRALPDSRAAILRSDVSERSYGEDLVRATYEHLSKVSRTTK